MISIHYALKGAAGLRMVATLDEALDQACRLLSAGAEVFEIAQRGEMHAISADEIRMVWRLRQVQSVPLV